MQSEQTKDQAGKWDKVFFWVAVAIATVNLVDFLRDGQATRDLVAAAGFALLAVGAFQRGFGRPAGDLGERIGRVATVAGLTLAAIGIVMGFMGSGIGA